MKKKPLASSRTTSNTSTTQTRIDIAEQTALFLKSGGKIDHIAQGVSGQPIFKNPKTVTASGKNSS